MKKYLGFSTFILLLLFVNCKKDITHIVNIDNITDSSKATIFTNTTDPRLAEIDTKDSQRILFFGLRNPDGTPKSMYGYTIASFKDLTKFDYVSLDSTGRYTNIILRTGEKIYFDYSQKDSVTIVISVKGSTGTPSEMRLKKVFKNHGSPLPSNPLAVEINGAKILGCDGSLNIQVTKIDPITHAETIVQSDQATVFAYVGNYPGLELPVNYDPNKQLYSLSIPYATGQPAPDVALRNEKITVSYLRDQLEKIGFDPLGKQDMSTPDLINKFICASVITARPEYKLVLAAICGFTHGLLFLGKWNDILNALENALEVAGIDLKGLNIDNNQTLTVVSNPSANAQLGVGIITGTTTVNQILSNNNCDVKLTFVSLPGIGASQFDGIYTGTYSGNVTSGGMTNPVSGGLTFTANNGSISLTTPVMGQGTVSDLGSSSFEGSAQDGITFTGTFLNFSGSASASGSWTVNNSGGTGSGTWSAMR